MKQLEKRRFNLKGGERRIKRTPSSRTQNTKRGGKTKDKHLIEVGCYQLTLEMRSY